MMFEFDAAKSAANLAKHGVGLEFGKRVFADPAFIVIPTVRLGDEEEREKAVGLVDERLWTAVYVERRERVRLISVRRSNYSE